MSTDSSPQTELRCCSLLCRPRIPHRSLVLNIQRPVQPLPRVHPLQLLVGKFRPILVLIVHRADHVGHLPQPAVPQIVQEGVDGGHAVQLEAAEVGVRAVGVMLKGVGGVEGDSGEADAKQQQHREERYLHFHSRREFASACRAIRRGM